MRNFLKFIIVLTLIMGAGFCAHQPKAADRPDANQLRLEYLRSDIPRVVLNSRDSLVFQVNETERVLSDEFGNPFAQGVRESISEIENEQPAVILECGRYIGEDLWDKDIEPHLGIPIKHWLGRVPVPDEKYAREAGKLQALLWYARKGIYPINSTICRSPGIEHPNSRPGTFELDHDLNHYVSDLQRRIKRSWFPPRGQESKRVTVIFRIDSDGKLSNLRLEKRSGVAVADQAALKAVDDAAPFLPLSSWKPAALDIQFTFDYYAFSGGGKAILKSYRESAF